MGNQPLKLLDRVRQCIRLKRYSIRNEPDCCPRRQDQKGSYHGPAGRSQTGLKGAPGVCQAAPSERFGRFVFKIR